MTRFNPASSISIRERLGNHEFKHRVAFGAFGFFLVWALAGCRPYDPVVATLLDRHDNVERAQGSGWTDAYVGFGLVGGEALRTGTASGARLRVEDGSLVRVSADTRLRLVRSQRPAPDDGPELLVESGAADVESAGGSLRARMTLGPTRLERGGRMRVRFDERVGGVVIEPFDSIADTAVVAERRAQPAVVRAAPPAETPPAARDTAPSEVTVAAGESAIVHDRGRPRLRLRFDHLCPAAGTVEIVHRGPRRERLTGDGAVTTRLRPGRQTYRLYCADQARGDKPRATGALWLRRDSGDARLARRSTRSTIAGDGRRYTLLFQGQSPPLELVWPAVARAARPLVLHLASADGERVLRVRDVHTRLRAGALRPGTHTWWYVASDGKQSPKTTLILRFNSAAPVAQFFAQGDAGATPGAISIDGVTIHGAKVSAAGQSVPVDDAGRFHAAVAPEAGTTAVAVRLELPRRGLHYYVRRSVSLR